MNGKISNLNQLAYVRRYTVNGGKEDGLKVCEINNGVIRLLLNESKAFDLMQLWHKGTNISFVSKNGFSTSCGNFLTRFEGGMVYTCGLDSVGGRDGFELHGSLHNHPAEVVSVECDEKEIKVVAKTFVSALFGQNLVLTRTVKTEVNSSSISIFDNLYNAGFKAEEYVLLYHVNLGYPMIDEGVKIISDEVSAVGRNDFANKFLDSRKTFCENADSDEERCYFIDMKTPKVMVENQKLNKRFCLEYSSDSLPYFVQWNTFCSGDYALGLEPATTLLDDKFKYKTIGANEKVDFNLTLSVEDI